MRCFWMVFVAGMLLVVAPGKSVAASGQDACLKAVKAMAVVGTQMFCHYTYSEKNGGSTYVIDVLQSGNSDRMTLSAITGVLTGLDKKVPTKSVGVAVKHAGTTTVWLMEDLRTCYSQIEILDAYRRCVMATSHR